MFGIGLIGTAIRDSLFDLEFESVAIIDFDWQDAEKRTSAFASIASVCVEHTQHGGYLSFVWSAGRAGFHTSEEDALAESASFVDTIDFVLKLRETIDSVKVKIHFISSAGGLFEGQRVVTENSIPDPVRPYGKLKLAQEQLLEKAFGPYEFAIYRPSSVYGPMLPKTQQGLINNLIINSRIGRVTVLDAHIMALRDYVYAGDIGTFIAKQIKSGGGIEDTGPIHFLVSSRCTSIFEVVHKIERILKIIIRLRYDESYGNASNITFSDGVLPTDWSPAALDVGVRQFLVGDAAVLTN
jgi:nucleoside-diphosphate-sugar epimerase